MRVIAIVQFKRPMRVRKGQIRHHYARLDAGVVDGDGETRNPFYSYKDICKGVVVLSSTGSQCGGVFFEFSIEHPSSLRFRPYGRFIRL